MGYSLGLLALTIIIIMAVITTIRTVIKVISAKPSPCGILKSLRSQMGALTRPAAERQGHSHLPGTRPAAQGSFVFFVLAICYQSGSF